MLLQQKLDKIYPPKLFLLDSLGALFSASMLGFVLTSFESVFGMPKKVLYFLAFIACIFAIYSFICSSTKLENGKLFMKVIAIANLSYCGLTIALLIFLYQKLSVLGFIYFALEIMVIIILATIELRTASKVPFQ